MAIRRAALLGMMRMEAQGARTGHAQQGGADEGSGSPPRKWRMVSGTEGSGVIGCPRPVARVGDAGLQKELDRAPPTAHCLVFLLSHPTHPGGGSFRGLVSRSLGGVGHASCVHVCAAERPPMLGSNSIQL